MNDPTCRIPTTGIFLEAIGYQLPDGDALYLVQFQDRYWWTSRTLVAEVLMSRVCTYFECDYVEHLQQKVS